jgi:hypothetical protein
MIVENWKLQTLRDTRKRKRKTELIEDFVIFYST